MKWLAAACLLMTFCSPTPVVPATDTREPIDVAYVTGPELRVHAQANDASPVIVKYENGESVSIMSRRGDWVEVRTGDRTGWAQTGDLGTGAQAKEQQDNPSPRFRRFPSPVSSPSTHGDLYFEADVNTDGDVVAVKVIDNTTGNPGLAAQNAASLQSAKFYPIVKNGERKPFKYYHRVTY
ncbi:MAG TPA: SH3 domain-containing protein [Thermoanaerobaculia bacterium]